MLGIAGALSGCPSTPARQDRTADVAPVQSAVVQRSIKDETEALIGYLKKSGSNMLLKSSSHYDASVFFGDRMISVSWFETKPPSERSVLRVTGDLLFEDVGGDGSCDYVKRSQLDELMYPFTNRQQKFEGLVRRIVGLYRQREEWIDSHSNAPANRPSEEECSNRARALMQYTVQNGRRVSESGGMATFKHEMSVDGARYVICTWNLIPKDESGRYAGIDIDKVLQSGEVSERFSAQFELGSCEHAVIPPAVSYSKSAGGVDAQLAVQLEYERTLDKLVNAIKTQ